MYRVVKNEETIGYSEDTNINNLLKVIHDYIKKQNVNKFNNTLVVFSDYVELYETGEKFYLFELLN